MLRRLFQSSFLALAALTPFAVRAAIASGSSEVVAVHSARLADIVLLGHGHDAGLRQGMICRVTRGGSDVAEIILVDLRPNCGSALIVSLSPGQSIRKGDMASVKILKT
jgi:hypothetical protein